MDIITRAREFAISAHKRIDHKRKYSEKPYSVHLAAVAKLVATVTDDPATIAAAWLHDIVEDTPAALYEIETEFGTEISHLVENLTDVSKPGDENRMARKTLDQKHLNCKDICKHEPRFALVYLGEMGTLLEVLKESHQILYQNAVKTHAHYSKKLNACEPKRSDNKFSEPPAPAKGNTHLIHLFTEAFSAQDITEPLRSLDIDMSCHNTLQLMTDHKLDIITLREDGLLVGYVRRQDLNDGICRDHLRIFRPGQVVNADSSFTDIIQILTRQEYCFVSILGEIVGFVSRSEINKPVVRMWLFGIITFLEMELVQMIKEFYPQDSWKNLLNTQRLNESLELREERLHRSQHCELLDCPQLSDKGQILIENRELLKKIDISSKSTAKRIIKEPESLRNNLAHSQDIVTYDWGQIVHLSYHLEETFSLRSN